MTSVGDVLEGRFINFPFWSRKLALKVSEELPVGIVEIIALMQAI
jgi:hypothetical protein